MTATRAGGRTQDDQEQPRGGHVRDPLPRAAACLGRELQDAHDAEPGLLRDSSYLLGTHPATPNWVAGLE
jgi:hypothetical protein